MKALFLAFILLCGVAFNLSAQVIRVPIGDESVVCTFPTFIWVKAPCAPPNDSCGYDTHGVAGIGDTLNLRSSKMYRSYDTPGIVRFAPTTEQEFFDTLVFQYYHHYGCFECKGYVFGMKTVHVAGYFDSTVKIRSQYVKNPTPGLSYGFTWDKSKNAYYQQETDTGRVINIYNNTPDTISCDNFSIKIDPSAKITMDVYEDLIQINTITLPPFSNKSVHCFFSTKADADSVRSWYYGFIHANVHFPRSDSMFALTDSLRFSFSEKDPVDVQQGRKEMTVLKIVQNPSIGELNIYCSIPSNQKCTIAVFDELGKMVQIIYNDFLDRGEHEFNTTLSPGMYYVRMQTGNEVVTQKMIVAK